MIKDNRRQERRVRSKGQVTLLADGIAGVEANVHDVAHDGIGLVAPIQVNPGTRVEIGTHGHGAAGVVKHCETQGDRYYLGIALEPPESPEAA